MYLEKEEHSHDLKSWADLADGLDLIPFVGHKVGPPDADRSGLTFHLTCFNSRENSEWIKQLDNNFLWRLKDYVYTLCSSTSFASWPLPVNKEYINWHLNDQLVEKLDSLDMNTHNNTFSIPDRSTWSNIQKQFWTLTLRAKAHPMYVTNCSSWAGSGNTTDTNCWAWTDQSK